MADSSQRQGPLDHLGLGTRAAPDPDTGVQLTALPNRSIVELRGPYDTDFANAAARLIRASLPARSPETTASDKAAVFWMGPDRWWIVSADPDAISPAELRQSLAAFSAAVFEIGESFASVRLAGRNARDVLAKGCTIDLHPRAFKAGQVIQTNLAKAQVALYQTDEREFQIFVRRSFAEYLWTWLEDAALEYGNVVAKD